VLFFSEAGVVNQTVSWRRRLFPAEPCSQVLR
jgi:hypothetical protein